MKTKTITSILRSASIVLLTLLGASGLRGAVNSFSDITQWVGTGPNKSALVIDFNDENATDSFAWGYRWADPGVGDPLVSGAKMILDIAAFDPLLSIVNGGDAASGFFLSEVRYGTRTATSDFVSTPTTSWGYYLAGGTAGDPPPPPPGNSIPNGGSSLPTSWTISPTGASAESFGVQGRILTDGSWDVWSFGENDASFNHLAPPSGPIAPAPEPEIAGLLLALGAFLLALGRRARK